MKDKKTFGVKALAALAAVALALGCVIGGTMAWLTDKTGAVTNTFTTSNIEVTLVEHTYNPSTDSLTSEETTTGVNNYKMVPGWTIPKDPTVKVSADSEDCFLFIKVEKLNDFDEYMDMAIDTAWKPLAGEPGVYYREITTSDQKNVSYRILAAGSKTYDNVTYTWEKDHVLVKPTVTKAMMDSVPEAKKPTLKFTAYASQYMKNNTEHFTPADAWANVPTT